MKALSGRLVLSLVLFAASFGAFAAPGEPDPTFGVNGVQLLDFGGPSGVTVVGAGRQWDGRIVVVGRTLDWNGRSILAFTRFNTDGTPDAGFGTAGGWAYLSQNNTDLVPIAMTVASDDSIRVVGKSEGAYTFIARMHPSGQDDGNNLIFTDYNSYGENPRAIAAEYSHLFVAGGCDVPVRQACVVAYGLWGGRDQSLGTNGRLLFGTNGAPSEARTIVPGPFGDSIFFVAGSMDDAAGNRDFFVSRMNFNLTIDTAFGVRTVDFGGQDTALAIAYRNNGHLVVAGHSESGGTAQLAMASMNIFQGQLDDTVFGTGGKVLTPMQWQGGPAYASVLALMVSMGPTNPDSIFAIARVGPTSDPANGSRIVIGRYDHAGVLVGSFGGGGFNNVPGGDSDLDVPVAAFDVPGLDSLVTVGTRLSAGQLIAARHYATWGMVDSGFGTGGMLKMQAYRATFDIAETVAADPGGGYVGVIRDTNYVYRLFRASPDGMLDLPFGSAGVVPVEGTRNQVVVQPDRKIVVVHDHLEIPGNYGSRNLIAVDRFDVFGSPDASFGSAGRAIIDFGSTFQTPTGIAVQADGKIVVASDVWFPGTPGRSRVGVARLLPNGMPDPAFSGGSIILDGGTGTDEQPRGVRIMADGRIVVAAAGYGPSGATTIVFRRTSTGGVDSTWAGGAAAFVPGCSVQFSFAGGVALAPGDAVVISGGTDSQGCIGRLGSSGALDPSFGSGGVQTIDGNYGFNQVPDVVVDNSGRVLGVFGGSSQLLRLNPDGSLDSSFNGGVVSIPNVGVMSAAGLIQHADQRVVAWGTGALSEDADVVLARFFGGGPLQGDVTPDPFTFNDLANVPINTAIESNSVFITGINVPAPVSIMNGTYSIGCAAPFTSEPGSVLNGQSICVHHTSPATGSTATNTTLTVGGVSDTFTSTTAPVPDTTITGMPPNPSTGAGATFTFTSPDLAFLIRFECAIDGGAWTVCTSPRVYSVAQGSHTFQVRAVSIGGTDPTPASYTWQVTLSQPDTSITSGPSDPTPIASTSATFAFTSNEVGATFQCSLDNSTFTACTSPRTYDNLLQGGHVFNVRAVGAAGTDPTPARRIFTVDTNPPDTTITSGIPPQQANATSATFAFTSNDPNATFQCRIDNLAFATCTSPATYSGLADGSHSFFVRAVDLAGNIDPSAASAFWTVDTVAPQTTITSGVQGLTTSTSATFSFTSSEAFSTFECILDIAGYVPCTSPVTYGGLSQGAHNFAVRAIDRAGNADPSAAGSSWTVDSVAPETTILQGPWISSNSSTATFFFSANEPGTLQCSFDGAAYSPCTSPVTYSGLADGTHNFAVRAIDTVGNVDATPATFQFYVDTIAPDTTIVSGPPSLTASNTATFAFTASEFFGGYQCKIDGGGFLNCTSPVTYSGLADGAHTFAVRFYDSAANYDPTPATYSWTVDTTAPDTTIITAPPALSNSAGASFTFAANDPGASLECSIDNLAFVACGAAASYNGLADGSHLFRVRAVDSVGNVDTTPASFAWTVDTIPPQALITSGPSGYTSSASATFSVSTEEGATLQCSLDGAAYSACASPVTYAGLADGAHSFLVLATDAVGNFASQAAHREWTVDTLVPDTAITAGPPAQSPSASATFTVLSNDPDAQLQCSLDGAAFAACASPVTYSGLAAGAHTFAVRAVDLAGNTDATPATASWTIDLTPPDTVISSAPSALTSSQNASFTFASDDAAAQFECAIDGGVFVACASPRTYSGLAEGLHTFQVRATDAAGSTDPTPAQHQWTIDVTSPGTLVTSGPPSVTSLATSTFTFQASEAGSTFECAVDGFDYAACSSPKSYSGLPDGVHRFLVRAIDAASNVGTPSVFTWAIDATNPDTTIDSSPPLLTSNTTAFFTFSANELVVTFQCRLDGAAFAACSSPFGYVGLAEGAHTFDVRALDAAGNTDAQPASWTWSIDRTPPIGVGIGWNGVNPTTSTTFTAGLFSSEPDATFECRLDGAPFAACPSSVTLTGLTDGSHTLDARAKDVAGNTGSIVSVTWVVDTAVPETTITSGPSGVVASNQATFMVASNEEPFAYFDCRLDGAPFVSCPNPAVVFSGLADGSHTFEVRARDLAGNVDATPASRTWTIDTVAPDTTITSGPTGTVASTAASFAFTSTGGATFECRIDGGAFAACSSPATLSGLAQGPHTFDVRARDAAGNVDASPASRNWSVDTQAPETTITSGPSGSVASTGASFGYTSSKAGSTFQCRVDGGAYVACNASGISYLGLAQGSHVFDVRATDAIGNTDVSPASRTWIVDTVAPDTTITGGPSGNNNPNTATFTFTSNEAGTFQCKLDTGAFAPCASGVTYTGLAKGDHTFQVQAIDAAGNVDASPATRAWRSK